MADKWLSVKGMQLQESERRFIRIECNNESSVEIGNVVIVKAKILNISLNGVLFEIAENCIFKNGDRWQLKFKLPESYKVWQFGTEVVRSDENIVGMKFLHIDTDAKEHLRYLLEAKTGKPEQIADEVASLT